MYSQKRNYTIDIIRVILAIMVVALHTSPLSEINFYIYYFSSHIFSRLAVPFFAAVSGYYLFGNYSVEKTVAYLRKMIIAFCFWTTLVCLVDWTFGFSEENIIEYLVRAFILDGRYALWYILAIIYTVVLTLFVYRFRINRKVVVIIATILLFLGICFNGYGNIADNIPLLKRCMSILKTDMQNGFLFLVIPYFTMGYLIRKLEGHLPNKNYWFLFGCSLCLYIGEIICITVLDVHKSNLSCIMTCPTVYLLIRAAISNKGCRWRKGEILSPISNVIYFSQSSTMFLVDGLCNTLNTVITPTEKFIIVCFVGCFLAALFIKLKEKNITLVKYIM